MSLRLKMLICIVVTMLGMMGILLTAAVLESARRSRDEAAERRRWSRRLTESWLSGQVFSGEESAVDRAVRPLLEARAVTGYAVFDGPRLVRGEERGVSTFPVESYRAATTATDDPDHYVRALALSDGREGVLVVRVDAPPVSAGTSLRYVLGTFWTMIFGTFLLVFILFLLFNRFLLRPLDRLLDASRRVALGDYSPRIQPDERLDEMGQMTTAFSYMLDEIKSFHEEQESRLAEVGLKIQKTERSLVVAQRLASTGTLAAGIAHEINNPIGGMLNAAYWIAKKGEDEAKRKQYAGLIVEGLTRVQETVKKVLQFSPRQIERRPTSLLSVIDNALALAAHRLELEEIRFTNELPADLPEVVIDPLEMQQVFLNLILNAADATGSGGNIRVHGEPTAAEVVVSVTDDGVGMSAEEAAQALDLFFTTKEAGKGTGLGLSIVHNIVHNHGGNLEIESQPGEGTTIRISLPLESSFAPPTPKSP